MPGRVWIYVLLFTLCTINYVDRVALSIAAGPIKAEFGLSTVQMGYVFSAFLWTYAACLIPWGVAVDRKGARWVAAVGIVVWSAATVATSLATSFATLFLARLVMGFGEASTFPAGGRAIREWVPARERGLITVIFNGGAYAGPALGSLFVAAVTSLAGWRSGFVAAGSIGFVWLAAWLVWFRTPERSGLIDDRERDTILAERGSAPATGRTGAGLPALLANRTLWALFITQGCAIYALYLFLTWMPSYLQNERHLTLFATGLYSAVPYAIGLVGTMLAGLLSDRWLSGDVGSGRRRGMVAGTMLVSAVILAVPWVSSTWLILALFTVSLIGIASASGLNIALLNDLLTDTADSGRANGFLITGGNLFGLAAPILTGYVISFTGSYDAAFLIAGGLLLGGAVVCLTMTRRAISTSANVQGPASPNSDQAKVLMLED